MSGGEAFKFDPSPLYRCDVEYVTAVEGRRRGVRVGDDLDADARIGIVHHWMAFDPSYGPESQKQIDYYRRVEGAAFVRGWEVGKPLPGVTDEIARCQRARFERLQAAGVVGGPVADWPSWVLRGSGAGCRRSKRRCATRHSSSCSTSRTHPGLAQAPA